jgi:rubrerythrin
MDTLEFAINMENDGVKYYTEQAAKNQGNRLNVVFQWLANDERNHAEILTNKMKGLSYDLKSPVHSTIKNVFTGLADFKAQIGLIPTQLDVYREAQEIEQKSIDLYKKLLAEAVEGKEIFQYLIEQEEGHYKIFEEIITMVMRPNEWVEFAEFGVREPY